MTFLLLCLSSKLKKNKGVCVNQEHRIWGDLLIFFFFSINVRYVYSLTS